MNYESQRDSVLSGFIKAGSFGKSLGGTIFAFTEKVVECAPILEARYVLNISHMTSHTWFYFGRIVLPRKDYRLQFIEERERQIL